MEFHDLFLRTVAAAFDKQLALSELIGDSGWSFDMDQGILAFGSSYHFKVQLLGTESDVSSSWLWAWANEQSGIPDALLEAAHQLRTYGQQNQIDALTEPAYDLQPNLHGHFLSMVASIVCKGDAYYRGPYDGGALFMLIKDPAFPRSTVDPALRIVSIFPELIMNVEISDHQVAFAYYLRYYHAEVSSRERSVVGKFNSGKVVTAAFDGANRLERLNIQ
jgi:hypothetical protein